MNAMRVFDRVMFYLKVVGCIMALIISLLIIGTICYYTYLHVAWSKVSFGECVLAAGMSLVAICYAAGTPVLIFCLSFGSIINDIKEATP